MNHPDVSVHRANGAITISISEAAIEQAAKPIAADSNEQNYTITDREEFLSAVATGIVTMENDSEKYVTSELRTLVRRAIQSAAEGGRGCRIG